VAQQKLDRTQISSSAVDPAGAEFCRSAHHGSET